MYIAYIDIYMYESLSLCIYMPITIKGNLTAGLNIYMDIYIYIYIGGCIHSLTQNTENILVHVFHQPCSFLKRTPFGRNVLPLDWNNSMYLLVHVTRYPISYIKYENLSMRDSPHPTVPIPCRAAHRWVRAWVGGMAWGEGGG